MHGQSVCDFLALAGPQGQQRYLRGIVCVAVTRLVGFQGSGAFAHSDGRALALCDDFAGDLFHVAREAGKPLHSRRIEAQTLRAKPDHRFDRAGDRDCKTARLSGAGGQAEGGHGAIERRGEGAIEFAFFGGYFAVSGDHVSCGNEHPLLHRQ